MRCVGECGEDTGGGDFFGGGRGGGEDRSGTMCRGRGGGIPIS